MLRSALFLDRDGVINHDHGYVYSRENFDFIDGIFELVAAAKRAEYLVVIVTNQAGIGRGYYTESDFQNLMDWVCEEFVVRGGVIDGIYFCPDHPEHGLGVYKRNSEFRKPSPGMILQAAAELNIDLTRSVLLGDKPSDIEAGRAAGIKTLLMFGDEPIMDGTLRISVMTDAINYL